MTDPTIICRIAIAARTLMRFTAPPPGRILLSSSKIALASGTCGGRSVGPIGPADPAEGRRRPIPPGTGRRTLFLFHGRTIRFASRRLLGSTRDDDRDIVRPAALVREGDQDVARGLRIARFDDDALNILVFHVVDQAVAA